MYEIDEKTGIKKKKGHKVARGAEGVKALGQDTVAEAIAQAEGVNDITKIKQRIGKPRAVPIRGVND